MTLTHRQCIVISAVREKKQNRKGVREYRGGCISGSMLGGSTTALLLILFYAFFFTQKNRKGVREYRSGCINGSMLGGSATALLLILNESDLVVGVCWRMLTYMLTYADVC